MHRSRKCQVFGAVIAGAVIFGFSWWTSGSEDWSTVFKKSNVTFVLPQRSQKSLHQMLVSISFIVPEMVACGGAQIAIFLACVAGAKRGGGGWREKSAKEGKRKGSLPSFPNPSLFFPSRLPFSRRVKQKQKKSVCSPPLQAPGWGIQEEICCNWLNTVNKSVKQENDSQLTNSGKSQPCITWIVTLSPIDHSRKYHYIPSCSLFFTPKFCISIVFTFSWELKWPQEKLKTIYRIWR